MDGGMKTMQKTRKIAKNMVKSFEKGQAMNFFKVATKILSFLHCSF